MNICPIPNSSVVQQLQLLPWLDDGPAPPPLLKFLVYNLEQLSGTKTV